ncbi:MAG: hypothetical protein ABFD50_06440, partial [Smithella sp.]
MLQIEPKDWVLLFGGAVVAIVFGFLANLTVGLFLRNQELAIRVGRINDERALKDTYRYYNIIRCCLAVWAILVGGYVVFGILFAPETASTPSSVPNLCENCSYSTTIIN